MCKSETKIKMKGGKRGKKDGKGSEGKAGTISKPGKEPLKYEMTSCQRDREAHRDSTCNETVLTQSKLHKGGGPG